MIESQQDRELVLRWVAEAWDEGYSAACENSTALHAFSRGVSPLPQRPINPYRMKEEK